MRFCLMLDYSQTAVVIAALIGVPTEPTDAVDSTLHAVWCGVAWRVRLATRPLGTTKRSNQLAVKR
jgi:hypothetical protein